MRMHHYLMLAAAAALALSPDPAAAQNRSTFQVDGDPMDWGGYRFDERQDVVPDTNRAVDLRGYGFGGGGRVFNVSDTLFTFLFQFLAPPFQGAEETTVEIFFDMSQSDSYGVEQGPWIDFRPDYVIGVTGSHGALTKEFYWRWTGSGWDKKEGADIPEIDMAFATRYLEGAWDWKLLDIPDTDVPYYDVESYNQLKAVRVSKGEYRDYLPQSGQPPLRRQILPSVDPDCRSRYRDSSWDIKCPSSTDIEADSWGRIKSP